MSESAACEPVEFLYAPESPTGASAQQYRSSAYAIPCFSLVSAALTVDLLDDPHRARFTFECVVEPTDIFASEEWSYDIPALEGEITGTHAWDAVGTLETELQPPEGRATRLRVRFRQMVRTGSQYRFWYAYDAPVRAVVSTRLLTRMVVCTGWLIFNLPCDAIRLTITLPERSRLVKSAPLGDVTHAAPGRPQVRHPPERLRSLESSHWLVAYQRRKIGLPLYLWTATQLAAGLVGWLIGRALDGWMGSG
jgi:hypothetical protein